LLFLNLKTEDFEQPAGEIDDSVAVNCFESGPLYGHPNVAWIRVANAPNFKIDQRINQNIDPDSDGIDFPKMDQYILKIRMRPYIFLQFVNVPSSNVVLLHVIVYFDSGIGKFRPYTSKIQQNPVVENFLVDEPIRYFEVRLNATDDGLPPTDVTLNVVCYRSWYLSIFISIYLGLLYSTEN
jgi:hypothetical protein